MSHVLKTPFVHQKFAHMNGEAAIAGLKILLNLHHDPHPWDDLWRSVVVEHPLRDAWWDDRNLQPLLDRVEVPVYLGCDWQNVPLHLPHTFSAFQRLTNSKHVRAVMLGEFGLIWPWESLHIEALAWFDRWLKNRDTGILDGPRFRYVLPGAGEWRMADLAAGGHHTQDTLFAVRRGTRPEQRRQRFTDHDDPRRWAQPTTCQPDGSPVES
jgi:predicted acyl esterase